MTKITVVVDKKGLHIDFEGFVGSTCYSEHEKLSQLLKRFGIDEKIERGQQKEGEKAEVKEHAEVKGS